ncbi:metallophosphoesterase family protein [Synergistaceae bacterium OttesenSCG-928-I11]|nr:metallophosphoesterase family protein [Synergistaceae bacterium OttesenSCG-928-I11]
MIYFTSDQHFFDSDIISFADRPYANPDEMNEDLIARFLAKTQDADEIYILGDIFGSKPPYDHFTSTKWAMERLGIKDRPFHLMRGNHDHLPDDDYRHIGFRSVMDKFAFIELGDLRFMISHDPCMVQPRDTLAICGHIHTLFSENWQPRRNTFTINVGVEVRNYEPISEAEILELVARSPYKRT